MTSEEFENLQRKADRKRWKQLPKEKPSDTVKLPKQPNEYQFVVPLLKAPVAKGRPRVTKGGQHTYTPKKTVKAEYHIRLYAVETCDYPLEGAVELTCIFYFPIPKGASKKVRERLNGQYRTKKPDLDNLVKLVKDALNGVAYEDDKQVARIVAEKRYGEPRIEVTVAKGA